MNITPPQSPQPTPDPFTPLPTTEFKTWARHLSAILDSARIDSVTSNDLTQCVFTHIKDHINLLVDPCDDTRYNPQDMVSILCEQTVAYARKNLGTQEKIVQLIRDLWLIVEKQPWSILEYHHHLMPCLRWSSVGWYFPKDGPCEPGAPCNPPKNFEEPHECAANDSIPRSGTFAEKRASWINSCRLASLLQREELIEVPYILDIPIKYVFEVGDWPNHSPDSALMGFEQVVDVIGQLLWDRGGQWDPEVKGKEGEELVSLWKEWEEKLNWVIGDEEREVDARESARRTMLIMKDIREKNEA